MADKPSAANSLMGLELPDGWTVVAKKEPHPGATGGHFSIGYVVKNKDGRTGFLKALDFARAFDEGITPDLEDLLRTLQSLTETYNFERDVLAKCRNLRLSRVATAVADGSVSVAGFEPLHRVFYLIFDLAKGDARAHLDAAPEFETVWCFRTLQHAATGLRQLHWNGIAHQDLKPSNVLEYPETAGARVGDLGRASQRDRIGPFDEEQVAGDWGYAPPELLYGYHSPDWHVRRLGCDAYLLGSLTFFFFSRASMTAAVMARLHPGHTYWNWNGTFSDVLVYLRQAFDEVINEFEPQIKSVISDPRIAMDVVAIIRELCEPDPALRGNVQLRSSSATQFLLDRYITRFDVLARRVALGRRK